MKILGISCYYHDSAACLVSDGEIVAAAQEERFTRKKHDFNFPKNAISYCLAQVDIKAADLDYVGFYDKPFVKFERILETALSHAPKGIRVFFQAMPLWLKEKLWIRDLIKKELDYKGDVLFAEHHESHAASAFYPSPFEEAAFLTIDGVGEWDTASFGIGRGNDIEMQYVLRFPHSLGLLYSAFTYFTGFRVNSGEYKLMGLAPYGEPKYVDLVLKELIDLKEDGSFKLNMKYFGFGSGLTMTNKRFEKLFGGPPRRPDTEITRREMDLARSIQQVTEEIMLRLARHVRKVTGMKKLCLAGGVALNCVGNGRILRETDFEDLWIQPASGDAGGALGVALLIWYMVLGKKRMVNPGDKDFQNGSYLGPEYSDEYIEKFLRKENAPYRKLARPELPEVVTDLVADEKVVGWFQGRLEFGPRALGARSIIGDARSPEMQSRINLKIKYRESFRPFAPSVLKEKAGEYFDIGKESPYMLLVAPIKKEKKIIYESVDSKHEKAEGGASSTSRKDEILERLKIKRSIIPAVTHVDYSARLQTVSREDNLLYYDLINAFYEKTGCPVIINTSFNVRGEPIVCTPEDAFQCFMRTRMDYLVMGSFLLDKSKQERYGRYKKG